MSKPLINIAIDGHSSCGKSTIAKSLAKYLGYKYLDTGAMYRGVTLYSMRKGLWNGDEPDREKLAHSLDDIRLDFRNVGGSNHLFLNGEDVEEEIRGMEVSRRVSPIATIPEVRAHLVRLQQEIARPRGVVMDGRDVGTVILPDAELKLFITASPEVRAQRRFDELRAKGMDVKYDEIYQNVITRDHIDSTREVGPLKQAEDALFIDNSDLTIEEQDRLIRDLVATRLSELSC